MYCDKCGKEIADSSKFCEYCGNEVTNATINNVSNSPEDNISKQANLNTENENALDKIGGFITAGLSIVSVVLLIGAFFGAFDKNPIPFIIFIGVVLLFNWLDDKFPKVPKIVFAVLEIIALIVCFNIAGNAGAVASVKGGSPNAYPDITYGEAFNDYFENPTWKSIGEDEDGNEVVRFTGNCLYLDESATADIKFTVYEDQGTFVVSSVKLNGSDMDWFGDALVMDVFEEYEQSH